MFPSAFHSHGSYDSKVAVRVGNTEAKTSDSKIAIQVMFTS